MAHNLIRSNGTIDRGAVFRRAHAEARRYVEAGSALPYAVWFGRMLASELSAARSLAALARQAGGDVSNGIPLDDQTLEQLSTDGRLDRRSRP